MSNVVIRPRDMMQKTAKMLDKLEEMEPKVRAAKGELNKVAASWLSLKGVAWDSVRKYIRDVQKPLMSTYSGLSR